MRGYGAAKGTFALKRLVVFLLPTLMVVAVYAYLSGAWKNVALLNGLLPDADVSKASMAAVPNATVAGAPATPAPKDPNEALWEQGRQAAQDGDTATARAVFADLVKRFPSSPIGGRAAVELAVIYKNAGDVFGERNILSEALGALGEEPLREQVVNELHRVNGELIFSRKAAPDSLTHTVKKGESLAKIAARYKVTPEFIQRVNGLASSRIDAGENLKVFEGPFDVVIEKSKFRLTVYRAGIFIREYKVGIGKNGSTPEGEWPVRNKLIDPVWDPPGPEYAASKAADNPLGTRWIGFDGEYGIHGTIEPQSIGKAESRGCVRLLNQEVEELYDLVIIGSKITVKL